MLFKSDFSTHYPESPVCRVTKVLLSVQFRALGNYTLGKYSLCLVRERGDLANPLFVECHLSSTRQSRACAASVWAQHGRRVPVSGTRQSSGLLSVFTIAHERLFNVHSGSCVCRVPRLRHLAKVAFLPSIFTLTLDKGGGFVECHS